MESPRFADDPEDAGIHVEFEKVLARQKEIELLLSRLGKDDTNRMDNALENDIVEGEFDSLTDENLAFFISHTKSPEARLSAKKRIKSTHLESKTKSNFGSATLISALISELRRKDPDQAFAAAEALAALGGCAVSACLAHASRPYGSTESRCLALYAIESMQPNSSQSAASDLRMLLQDPISDIRSAACRALGSCQREVSIETAGNFALVLAQRLNDPVLDVRESGVFGLTCLGPRSLPALSALMRGLRKGIVDVGPALAAIGVPAARMVIAELIDTASRPNTRIRAAEILLLMIRLGLCEGQVEEEKDISTDIKTDMIDSLQKTATDTSKQYLSVSKACRDVLHQLDIKVEYSELRKETAVKDFKKDVSEKADNSESTLQTERKMRRKKALERKKEIEKERKMRKEQRYSIVSKEEQELIDFERSKGKKEEAKTAKRKKRVSKAEKLEKDKEKRRQQWLKSRGIVGGKYATKRSLKKSMLQSDAVTPTDQSDAVTPADQSDAVTPADQSDAVTPADQSDPTVDSFVEEIILNVINTSVDSTVLSETDASTIQSADDTIQDDNTIADTLTLTESLSEGVTLSDADQSDAVTPADQSDAVTPADQSDAVIPVDQSDAVTPADQSDAVTPADQSDAVIPAEQSDAVTPADQSDAVTPADQSDAVIPADQSDAVTPADQSNPVIPLHSYLSPYSSLQRPSGHRNPQHISPLRTNLVDSWLTKLGPKPVPGANARESFARREANAANRLNNTGSSTDNKVPRHNPHDTHEGPGAEIIGNQSTNGVLVQSPKPPSRPVETITSAGELKNVEKVQAVHSFDGKEAGDLSLTSGDIITVLKKDSSGWWIGQIGDDVGLFPGNYVRTVE